MQKQRIWQKSGTCTNGKHDIIQILKVVYIATVGHIAISCGAFSQNNPKTNIWSMYITLTVKEKT